MSNIPDVKAMILAKQLQDYVNNYAGDAFFADLAQRIANDTGVSYVLIGHLLPEDHSKIKTVVLVAKGEVVGNMTYSLYGTPCENVVGRNCCYFPSSVQKMFPEDKELQDLNIESYIGSPLTQPNGEPLGLIVLMNETKIQHAAAIEQALASIAERTANELAAALTVAA